MMQLGDRIQLLLKNQKGILKEYEEVFKEINSNDSINENIRIKKEIDLLKKELQKAEKEIGKLNQENMNIKISLKEQIFNERNVILNASKKKIELYFQNEKQGAINRLDLLENAARNKVRRINQLAADELQEKNEEFHWAIDKIQRDLDEKIRVQKEQIKEDYTKSIHEVKMEYDSLQENISGDILAKKQKQNNLEVKIGLDWINKIGIILLLFGVATAMKYTYSEWLNNYMKGIAGFLLGGLILAAGEWFNRKGKNLFALGLCGGGIGALYLTVFSSYFFLEILTLPVSMIFSVLITLGAIALSRRYNSRTIAGISLFGGYLPFFSFAFMIGLEGPGAYVAMGYLMILNILVLVMAFDRRWIYMNYLSFILNIPCLIGLVFVADNEIISIIYALLTFVLYLGITLAYPIRKNIKLRVSDLILLGINTTVNCLLVYSLFDLADLNKYMGFLALIYAVGYFALSRIIHNRFSQEKHVHALFSITALTFSILMIPFQFGIQWMTMGWLVEAILILVFAKKRNVEKIELGGWVILGLCAYKFFMVDFFGGWDMDMFAIRYTSITLGLIYAFTLYIPESNNNQLIKNTSKIELLNGFKYFIIINSWIYLLRIFGRGYDLYLATKLPSSYIYFYKVIIMAIITILFAYSLLKIEAIRDKVVRGISVGLLIISNLLCIQMNFNSIESTSNPLARWIGIGVLIIYNVWVFISIKDMILYFVKKQKMNIEFYPLIIAIYLLGVTSVFLTIQLSLENISLLISIIFVVSSFICIVFGFKKNYVLIRRFGLGLSIFSTAKLFIFDLINLSGLGKIIGYFCFGLVLLGISFIYQKLKSDFQGVDNHADISQ
ncbi:MAG TPA: DUF2339 domain-containing protein [Epulopiscium sp.]|nr:DUF2339 domain-containing protein [Candidatus Epulonipiscium sp.]